MPAERPDRRVVACNYTEGTNVASTSALAYIALLDYGGGFLHNEILVRSRGGRWVRKREHIRRLTNFRAKTIPPPHPLYTKQLWDFDADELAPKLQAAHDAEIARRAARGNGELEQ